MRTFGSPFSSFSTRESSAAVALSFMYTPTSTRLRMLSAAPRVACTIGMKTPTTTSVTVTVASAAKHGAALRRIARSDSRKKKPRLCLIVI